MLQDLRSDHLPIQLIGPFFCYSAPTNVTLPSIFRELVGMTFYFDSHCPSAEEYSSLFLSCAAALFTSLTLNAAKFSISFGRIKRQPKVWWSAKMKDVRQGALIRLERSSEFWCLPLDLSKCKASFFSVDSYQGNFQPSLSSFSSRLRFNPTPTFLEVILDCLSFLF